MEQSSNCYVLGVGVLGWVSRDKITYNRERNNKERKLTKNSTEVMVSNVETFSSKKDEMQTSIFFKYLYDQFSKPERHDVLKDPTPFLIL